MTSDNPDNLPAPAEDALAAADEGGGAEMASPGVVSALDGVTDPVFSINPDWIITRANPAAADLLSRQAEPVVGGSARSVFPDAFGAVFNRECARALRFGLVVRFEEQYLPLNTWLEVHIYPDSSGATVLMHDAADRRRDAELLEDHARVLERIARGGETRGVLESVTGLVERHGIGLLAAVFAVEPAGGPLRVAAGPSLPPDFLQVVDNTPIAADGSPVGQSAHAQKPALVGDLLLEPAEQRFREAAGKHGFRACWAVPILTSEGAVAGVLAVFRREPGRPGDAQTRLLHTAANLAGIAIERQLTEADLRQKEQEYRSIFETVQDALIVADTNGYIVEVNPAAGRMHGSSYDALLKKQATELVRADYHGALRRMLDEVRQGREYRSELVCIRRDGSSFAAELTAAPFAFKGQRHVLVVVRDVSSRKKMEDSLHRTEERLRTVANGAPLVLFSLDRTGTFTLSEGQALASLGLRPGEVVGRNALEVYGAFPVVVENLKLALGGEPRRFTADIGERAFETIVRPLRTHHGEIVGAVGVAIDITEHTLTTEALYESEERFRASFHQSPLGVAHTTLEGVVIRTNDRLASLLATTAQEIVGRRVREWYADPADVEQDAAAIRSLLAGTASSGSSMPVVRRADDSTLRPVVSLSLVRGRYGEAKHLIYIVTPIPADAASDTSQA